MLKTMRDLRFGPAAQVYLSLIIRWGEVHLDECILVNAVKCDTLSFTKLVNFKGEYKMFVRNS